MSTSVRIDASSEVAIIECVGTFDGEASRKSVEQLWACPDWSGRAAVWDFRSADLEMTADDVRQTAAFVLDHQPDRPPERVSFVASTDVVFGLSRMFELYREDPKTAFRVFRSLEDAIAWTSDGIASDR